MVRVDGASFRKNATEMSVVASQDVRIGSSHTSSEVNKLDVAKVGKWPQVVILSWFHNIRRNILGAWSTINAGN